MIIFLLGYLHYFSQYSGTLVLIANLFQEEQWVLKVTSPSNPRDLPREPLFRLEKVDSHEAAEASKFYHARRVPRERWDKISASKCVEYQIWQV